MCLGDQALPRCASRTRVNPTQRKMTGAEAASETSRLDEPLPCSHKAAEN